MIWKSNQLFFPKTICDDTSLTATGKDLDVLLQGINSELPAIHEWSCSNGLTLNLSETKYLVFQPRQKINSNLYPLLKLADQYLEQSYSVKYLGLIIDCFLSWHEHIYHISSKISKSVNIIAKLKPRDIPISDKHLLCTCIPLSYLWLRTMG